MISVIVPTFNRASVLLRAVESVFRQTYSAWELIVVDDGSTDNSAEILRTWAADRLLPTDKLKITSTANRGVSAARNTGAAQAKGEWLAFLDSDDEWLLDKLERQVSLMNSFRWIHGEEIWVRNGVQVPVIKKYRKSGGRVFRRCVDVCMVSPSTVLIEKNLFFESGGFREDFVVCEDYDLWLRLASRLDVGFVPEPVIRKYGGHADQLSLKYFAMDHWRCLSLDAQVSNPDLSHEERDHVVAELARRREILARGFAKHGANRDPQSPFGGTSSPPLRIERDLIR